ncbi:MAG: hypothetical protein M1831_000684 [Alyxoria varia]|nr:MAG: hypothetical protein M1831_000684 [Alyxoria varia]
MESNTRGQDRTHQMQSSSAQPEKYITYDANALPPQECPRKRFEPIPIETSMGSTRKRNANALSNNRDLPSLKNHAKQDSKTMSNNISIETYPLKGGSSHPTDTNRRLFNKDVEIQEPQSGSHADSARRREGNDNGSSEQRSRRKFSPMLLETTKRSRKSSDAGPAVLPQDKTNVSPGDSVNEPRWTISSNSEANGDDGSHSSRPADNDDKPRHSRPNALHSERSHSFKVPELDAIESSESEKSDESKRPSSNLSKPTRGYQDSTRVRESVDERFSGYLLDLAAQSAQKQLRDQEAVVFPTTDIHEPVNHFVDDDNEEFGSPSRKVRPEEIMSRRESADGTSAIQEMRRHGERIRQEQEDANIGKEDHVKAVGFEASVQDATKRVAKMSVDAPKKLAGAQPKRDSEVKQMRRHASPPMLGGDIDFPRCPSPDHAVFSVRDGLKILETESKEDEEGLWDSHHPRDSTLEEPAMPPGSKTSGLWGGCCTEPDIKVVTAPSGMATPSPTPNKEGNDPFSSCPAPSSHGTTQTGKSPITPPLSVTASHEDIEAILDQEFPDSYVTHVYNYISLGFPALARRFDQHLSEDTGMSVEELREDDKLAQPMGYLRLGDEEPSQQQVGVSERQCKRWIALRTYIRQWGMENIINNGQKRRDSDDPHRAWGLPGAWGAAGRRGSWAN